MRVVPLLRGCVRSAHMAGWIAWWLVESRFVARRPLATRCQWRQRQCARLVKLLHIDLRVEGTVPAHGLMVSNHLGYIDVIVLGSLAPCVFVSKAEVAGWPVFGTLTRAAGTLYVERESMRSAAATARRMAALLTVGEVVTVFPEGTSSDGRSVLPFQSPLFEAASRASAPVCPAAVWYDVPEGDPARCVAYWGEMTLGPHLFGLLCQPRIEAFVRFGEDVVGCDRRELAARAQAAVSGLLFSRRSKP